MSFFHLKSERKRKGSQHISKKIIAKHGCKLCNLKRGVNSPAIPPSGAQNPHIYILGEAPGYHEDQRGIQFVGKSGEYLRQCLDGYCSQYRIRFNNCVRCRPPNNRKPTLAELDYCRKSVAEDIERSKPKIIFGLGGIPFKWMFHRSDKISLWRGRCIPVKIGEHVCWYYAMFHPSYIRRQYKPEFDYNKEDHCFQLDMKSAAQFPDFGTPPYIEEDDIKSGIVIDEDYNLNRFINSDPVAIDIETNKLRPFQEGAEILSIAVSNGLGTVAYQVRDLSKLKNFILNSGPKIVHNLHFELEWLSYFLGREVIWETEWEDTMILGYCLDERKVGTSEHGVGKGALNLNDMTLLHFGFELKKYSPIQYNNIKETPLEDLLIGNALDANWTYEIFNYSYRFIRSKNLENVYSSHIGSAKACVSAQARGVKVDLNEVKKHDIFFRDKIKKAKINIEILPEVQKFERVYNRKFNPGSTSKDLADMFFGIMDMPKVYSADNKCGYSLDKDALKEYADKGCKLAQYIPDYRTCVAHLGRYGLEGIQKDLYPDGRFHTNYNSTGTTTARLSSDDPNLQNYDNRKYNFVRSAIVADDGYWLVPCDYGQIEARLIAVASGDKNLLEAIRSGYDIHMDWARRTAMEYPPVIGGIKYINDKQVMNELRKKIKNTIVFPAFYGAFVSSIAKSLDIPLHIMKKIMKEFWEMFSSVKKWQQETFNFYLENGYVCNLLGKRRHMPIDQKQIFNDTIQSLAAYVVMNAMYRLSKLSYETGIDYYQPVLNVHDDLTFLIPEDKLDTGIQNVVDVMLEIVPPFDFINVPMSVEVQIGRNWRDVVEYETFSK